MRIENQIFNDNCFRCCDLFFFAIGYEERSYYLYDKIKEKCCAIKSFAFAFDDYEKYAHASSKCSELKRDDTEVYVAAYADSQNVHNKVIDTVQNHMAEYDSIVVHIDYSSMPRGWYCKLPILLKNVLRSEDKVYFWYSEGEYPESYQSYPRAGIDAFSFFSGRPSLQIDNNRIHVLGLGFDVIRTQAILSITDPSCLVSCYAYNAKRNGFSDSIKSINHNVLSRSSITVALHIDDFEFMISKLCETANELLSTGDVVMIPDGPKPLIFAFSLVPDLVNKYGVTCLHVSRNSCFQEVNVRPTGEIFGFSMQV